MIVLTKPGFLLRAEGAALFVLSVCLYRFTGAGWGTFLLLFLWPDVFMLGYIWNVRIGSLLYNLVHTEILPIALAGFAVSAHRLPWLSFALIWIAHIGFDRALGFGLKYPTAFKDTHLQCVG
jgi:hypothetical protein